jgi:Dolichyl-phosphate-mannose-protein mannosyltransferase
MGAVARRLRVRLACIDRFDAFAAVLLAALIVIAIATFDQYAISNDEEVQHRYGELIIAYYASGFADQAVFHFKNLYLYGGLFDVVAVFLAYIVPFDPYFVRHVLCALIGIAGIGATWGAARLVGGPRAGALAAVALAVCGPWYGAMFNHTKDIPFAAAMMGATYILLRASRDLPRPRMRDVLGFGIVLGAALGVRVAGLLLLGYLAAAIVLAVPCSPRTNWRDAIAFVGRSLAAFLPAFLLGYLIMIAAWPWAAQAPLNPLRALGEFANFHYNIQTVLAGHVYKMAEVPRWYVPLYLAVKLPIPILLGVLLAVLFAAWTSLRETSLGTRERGIALLMLAAFFPLTCQVIGHGPAFTGIRHFLFVVPPLAALAGVGLHLTLTAVESRARILASGAAAALAAGLLWNAGVLIRLHPHQYLFFNPFVGGLAGAAGSYDTDYWVNIMPEAVDDLEAFLDRTERPGRDFTVAVCGERISFEREADTRLHWVKDWRQADFFIAPTHMNCDRALDGKVIATIERLGVPIGVIKDRRALTRPDVAHKQ